MKKTALATLAAGSMMIGAQLAAVPAFAQDAKPESPEQKISYGLGMMISERILKQYDDIDYDLLMKGIQDQQAGGETDLSMEEAQAALQAQAEESAAAASAQAAEKSEAFLEENKAKDGVMVTDSGLQYEVMEEADGPKPGIDDTVSVDYVGTLVDGTEFDSSIARGEPAEFPLKGVIPGWTEGLQLMPVGSKYRFVIPPDLAYGDRGAGEAIGPGETLIFEVTLNEIK